MDNLNTHAIASLYQTFRLGRIGTRKQLEIHYTPKHGSWPNITEIELSEGIGSKSVPDLESLNSLLKPWYVDRNRKQRGVDRQLTTDNA